MNEISPVLVTGGAGFLGRFVLDALRESGDEPIVLDRPGAAGDEEVLCADLVEGPPDLRGLRPKAVMHLAGLAHVVPQNEAEGRRFYEVNVSGTKNLLLGLERTGELPEALVFVSTVAVYGVEEGEALGEDAPRKVIDPYGKSKQQAEDLLVEWGERMGVRIGIVRLPLVAGRDAPGNLGAMVSALRRGRYLGIGRGDARRSMVLAVDVARTLPGVAASGGVFHLTDGHHPSFRELEDALCRVLGRTPPRRLPLTVARMLAAAGDAVGTVGLGAPFSSRTLKKMTSNLTFSDERARRELGWRPSRVVDAAETLV
jgi:nucleoside-diphosphate-sugar epimerase